MKMNIIKIDLIKFKTVKLFVLTSLKYLLRPHSPDHITYF